MLVNSQNKCNNVIRVQSAAVSGDNFVLTTDSLIVPTNASRYLLVVPASILPSAPLTTVNQVVVNINGEDVPLQCRIGNNVYTDQLKCFEVNSCGNIVARVVYGSTPAHFKILTQALAPSTAYGVTAPTTETTDDNA